MKEQQRDYEHCDKTELLEEKQRLQQTLRALTEEVEFLSKKNEQFLKDLRQRDFYSAYQQQQEELIKLREAHIALLMMNDNGETSAGDKTNRVSNSCIDLNPHQRLSSGRIDGQEKRELQHVGRQRGRSTRRANGNGRRSDFKSLITCNGFSRADEEGEVGHTCVNAIDAN